MKVQDIMTTSPESCTPGTNLAAAVERLWAADCGVLPVTDDAARVVGIVTDRDICIALGTRDRPASQVLVADVMCQGVLTCQATDEVSQALVMMKDRRVRRLPVVDAHERLIGILSLNDLALAASPRGDAVRPAVVFETFKTICAPSLPAPRSSAA